MRLALARSLLLAAAALAVPAGASSAVAQPRSAAAPAGSVLSYKGFAADVAEIARLPNREAILAALRRQIDICEGAGLAPDKLAFIRSVPLALRVGERGDSGSVGTYHGDGRGVTMRPVVYDADKPILLHEYMHAYHHLRLPGGVQNPDIQTFFDRARGGQGLFPLTSYMLTNVKEYFAMTASVYLHGSAAREPHTREILKARQPFYYQWLEREFGAR